MKYYPYKHCETCKIELDCYISKWGAKMTYHYLTKFCHICLKNRIKARNKTKQKKIG